MSGESLHDAWSGKSKSCQGSFWLADNFARELSSEQAPITAMETLTLKTQRNGMRLTDNQESCSLMNPHLPLKARTRPNLSSKYAYYQQL